MRHAKKVKVFNPPAALIPPASVSPLVFVKHDVVKSKDGSVTVAVPVIHFLQRAREEISRGSGNFLLSLLTLDIAEGKKSIHSPWLSWARMIT